MDDLTIIIAGQSFGGWTDIRVSRGCERIPSSFDIGATERYPGQLQNIAIPAGSPCQVKIGADLVLTGYVDRVQPAISARQHTVRLQGRSKVEDIVDCSVTNKDVAGLMVTVTDLVALAKKVCAPFGIDVNSLAGATIPITAGGQTGPVPIAVTFGETGYELIERIARYVQVLVYDDANGNLVLAQAGGGGQMASGFVEGVNIQAASGVLSMDERYSVYIPSVLSYQLYMDGGGGVLQKAVPDPSVPRYRPLYVVSEQVATNATLAQQRAKWEMARRCGRSQQMRVVCDSWRDAAGTLWQPNAFAPLSIPSLKMPLRNDWVIGEVSYVRDLHGGTTAELMLMPKQAFEPEPEILLPFGWYEKGLAPSPGPAARSP